MKLTCGPCVNLFPVRKKTFVYSTVLSIPTPTINNTVHLYSVLNCVYTSWLHSMGTTDVVSILMGFEEKARPTQWVVPRAGQIALNAFFAIRGACMYGSCWHFAISPKIRSASFISKTATSIWCTILDLDGSRARFSPFARAQIARSDFLAYSWSDTSNWSAYKKSAV